MASMKELQDDLGYVASTVRRSEPRAAPSIFLLWAILILPGFCFGDFAPEWLPPYCTAAGIIGGLATWWLDRRHVRLGGELDAARRAQRRRAWIGGIGVGIGCAMLGGIIVDAQLSLRGIAQLFLLLQGIVCTTMGAYYMKEYLPAGLLMFVGCAALFYVPSGAIWTSAGIAFSLAMLTGWLFTRNAKPEIAS
ncbi:MAG TPA: hypothetical protein VFB36_06910 [Nevskiaceae bacterium]|nr:hypothetical protein [Nevskiaceae bacterium]